MLYPSYKVNQLIKKGYKLICDIQKNIENVEKLVLKKEEHVKEIKENRPHIL